MRARWAAVAALWACSAPGQQEPFERRLHDMTVSIGEVRIGADEHGRSELCDKLLELRNQGFPVTPSAKGEALEVQCQGRPAKVIILRLKAQAADRRKALCEYASAPAGVAFDGIDWVTLRRGGLAMTGEEMRNRLEPLSVRTLAALLFAFGFDRIEARDGDGKTLLAAPLHQIDGFCAERG